MSLVLDGQTVEAEHHYSTMLLLHSQKGEAPA